MASAALVDASAIVAAFGLRQPSRERYRALLQTAAAEAWSLSTTWPCIVEASHLLDVPRRYTMLRWVGAGAISVFPIDPAVLDELVQMMVRWTERPHTEMDLADASLVWLAADTGVMRIMTRDGRDFTRYRLPDGRAFEIL
jgi:predicted nucleic acid-binding protein